LLNRPQGGEDVKQRYILSVMCGRSTYKLTWEEIVALYRLTLDQPARNTQARYNVCPTTTIDTVVLQRWPVSKRVNSSRAPDDDPTLIERISVQ
jgi:putative SOS response-associated peptidase YedK